MIIRKHPPTIFQHFDLRLNENCTEKTLHVTYKSDFMRNVASQLENQHKTVGMESQQEQHDEEKRRV